MATMQARVVALASAATLATGLAVASAAPAHAAPSVEGTSISAHRDATFSAAVASISSFAGPRSGLAAVISWGDGSSMSTGTLAGPVSTPAVFGTHRYSAPGAYTVWVVVFDASGARSVTSTVTVG